MKASPTLREAIGLLELSKTELIKRVREKIMKNTCLFEDKQMFINWDAEDFADIIVKGANGRYGVELDEKGIPCLAVKKIQTEIAGKDYRIVIVRRTVAKCRNIMNIKERRRRIG